MQFIVSLERVPEPVFLRQYPLVALFRHQQADYYLLANLVSTWAPATSVSTHLRASHTGGCIDNAGFAYT